MANISIEDMVLLAREIEQLRGKYIKQILASIETSSGGVVDRTTRKHILDGMNNYTRAVHAAIGYPVER